MVGLSEAGGSLTLELGGPTLYLMTRDIEEALTQSLAELKRVVDTGAPADVYAQQVHAAAAPVYLQIKSACEAGYEVWVYKGSGRILKIGAVGDLRGTRFVYSRAPFFPPSEMDEQCELVVAVDIQLKKGFS